MTEQKAITPYDKLRNMIRADETQARFREVLGQRSPAFLASVLSTVHTSDYLRDADPQSIVVSAMKAAVLDLPVEPALGLAFIVPYKERGIKRAQFQIGYKGFIQLALRSGRYKTLNVTEIYEGERVRVDRLTGQVVLNGEQTSDTATGYVAYMRLVDGFEKYLYMSLDQINTHAKRYSKSFGMDNSAWTTSFDAMAKKTVIKALLSKYGVLSIDLKTALESEPVEQPPAPVASNGEAEVVDAAFEPEQPHDEPEVQPEATTEAAEEEQPEINNPKAVYWAKVKDLGLDRETGTAILNECNRQFDRALAVLIEQHQPPK